MQYYGQQPRRCGINDLANSIADSILGLVAVLVLGGSIGGFIGGILEGEWLFALLSGGVFYLLIRPRMPKG